MPLFALAAPTVFPLPPDPQFPVRLAREWLTDITQPDGGPEVRAGLRSVPVRRLEYTAAFANQVELGRFRELWMGATERLRFIVPLWGEGVAPIAIAGSTITLDTRDIEGFADDATVIVWFSEDLWELATIASVTDTAMGLTGALAETYPIGPTMVIPVMTAWLDPPTADQKSADVEVYPFVFREELPGVAGIDSDVDGAVSVVADSLTLERIKYGSPVAGLKFGAWRAVVRDASGIEILAPAVTWSVTEHADFPLAVKTTLAADGRELGVEVTLGGTQSLTIHAETGALSADVEFTATS